jgi:hypothetical protein
MTPHFRRPLLPAPHERRPHGACQTPAVTPPSLSALVATILLFDRDPGAMIAQVRVWLAEEDDRA